MHDPGARQGKQTVLQMVLENGSLRGHQDTTESAIMSTEIRVRNSQRPTKETERGGGDAGPPS